MGLDMWLRARTKAKVEGGETTGVCSGLFPIGPSDEDGSVEIGYWRKAYDQQSAIWEALENSGVAYDGERGGVDSVVVSKEAVDEIIAEAEKILETHTFDDEGGDPDSFLWTFASKGKWEDTIKFFSEAKRIYEEDPDAVVYYSEWQ